MRTSRAVAALFLSTVTLAACKGHAQLTTFPATPGYTGGTPVTLADGTRVTLPDGTPVTTPVVKASRSKTRTADGSVVSGTGGTTSTSRTGASPATAKFVNSTGTTAVSTQPNVDHLALPKPGTYSFHDTIVEDDGSPTQQSDPRFSIGVSGQTVRTQGIQADGSAATTYYEESHASDGLFLTNSKLSSGSCGWSPKAASLPQAAIDGGRAATKSQCTATVDGQPVTFRLDVLIEFKRIRSVMIGKTQYRCIDVARHRVLSSSDVTETVDAIDTYAFDLGLRIEVSEHVLREGQQPRGYRHHSVLTAFPS